MGGVQALNDSIFMACLTSGVELLEENASSVEHSMNVVENH
jgi:hypothetical protein